MSAKLRVKQHAFKILIIFTVMFAFVFALPFQQSVSANVITKPVTVTAKKVLKEAATNSAVEMANEIVSQYLVTSLLLDVEQSNLQNGYGMACLDKTKTTVEDCHETDRIQVKQKLTDQDKKLIGQVTENKIETITNTDTRFKRFLDLFIPIFLASGAVAFISAALDDDSESLIDELAIDSLLSTGIIQPLVANNFHSKNFNFDQVVTLDDLVLIQGQGASILHIWFKTNRNLQMTYKNSDNVVVSRGFYASSTRHYLGIVSNYNYATSNPATHEISSFYLSNHENTSYVFGPKHNKKISISSGNTFESSLASAHLITKANLNGAQSSNNPSVVFNTAINLLNISGFEINFEGLDFNYPAHPVKINSLPSGTKIIKIKPENNGTVPLPGLDNFTYIDTETKKPVIPVPNPDDATTPNWVDKNTGESVSPDPDKIETNLSTEIPEPNPEEIPTPTPPLTDLDQLGNNIPKELIFALLDMLRSILDFMVRLVTFVVSIPFLSSKPIPNETVMWFFNAKFLGIYVMDLVRTLAMAALGLGVYRILKKVF